MSISIPIIIIVIKNLLIKRVNHGLPAPCRFPPRFDIKLSSSWQVRVRNYRPNNKEPIRKRQIVQHLFHHVSLWFRIRIQNQKLRLAWQPRRSWHNPLSHGGTPQLEPVLDWSQVASYKGSRTRRKLLSRWERNNSIWARKILLKRTSCSDKMAVFTSAFNAKVAVKFFSIISITDPVIIASLYNFWNKE